MYLSKCQPTTAQNPWRHARQRRFRVCGYLPAAMSSSQSQKRFRTLKMIVPTYPCLPGRRGEGIDRVKSFRNSWFYFLEQSFLMRHRLQKRFFCFLEGIVYKNASFVLNCDFFVDKRNFFVYNIQRREYVEEFIFIIHQGGRPLAPSQ